MAFQLLPLPPKVYSPHSSQSHLFEKRELLSCDFRVENSSDGPITLKSRIETLHHGLLGARVTCTLTSPPISFPIAHSVAATLTFVSEPTKTATSSGLWHWLVPLPRIPCALLTGSLTLIRDPPHHSICFTANRNDPNSARRVYRLFTCLLSVLLTTQAPEGKAPCLSCLSPNV